jgi:hypothetical protein
MKEEQTGNDKKIIIWLSPGSSEENQGILIYRFKYKSNAL